MINPSNLLYSLEDMITGLDFNPTGEYVATIDEEGVCLISDVTTANYTFHKEVEEGSSGKFDSSEIFFLPHKKQIIKHLAISISLTSLN